MLNVDLLRVLWPSRSWGDPEGSFRARLARDTAGAGAFDPRVPG